jgi:hypothetical protein
MMSREFPLPAAVAKHPSRSLHMASLGSLLDQGGDEAEKVIDALSAKQDEALDLGIFLVLFLLWYTMNTY